MFLYSFSVLFEEWLGKNKIIFSYAGNEVEIMILKILPGVFYRKKGVFFKGIII